MVWTTGGKWSRHRQKRTSSTSSVAPAPGAAALFFSGLGLVLCAVLAFALVAPHLGPWGWYAFVRRHNLDFWALVIGWPRVFFAGLGTLLGWLSLHPGRRVGPSARLARAAVVVGIVAIALAALGRTGDLLLNRIVRGDLF
jgi:hypothetical protein